MITVYPYENLGHVNHGWLDARHHFSFASYWNPKRTHFGKLRVINDDRVMPGKGFATHAHTNMEIITYVRQGAITHKDSMRNEGRTEAGDIQVMSAGSGVSHSEYNLEKEDTQLYQIWIEPNSENVKPYWETRQFPTLVTNGHLSLLVSGRIEDHEKNALFIHQDAAIYGGRLKAGAKIEQPIKYQAYILASMGSFTVNGTLLKEGDGAEVRDSKNLTIIAITDSEILVIDVPEEHKD